MATLELSTTAALEGRERATGDVRAAVAPDGPGRRTSSAFGGHLPALDGVRGLAILMVLLLHFVAQTTATSRYEAAVDWVLSYGLLGVDLFFVLSGFLITGILYDSRAEPGYFRTFYMRRVLRIFPLYYGVLAVVFFVVPLVPALRGSGLASLREHQAWAWLYGVNVYVATHGGWGSLSYIEHFWSLAVEEHFYFVWPLVVWWLAPRPRLLMRTALGIAVVSFAARVAASLSGVGPVATTVLTPFQLDALCLGGLLAVALRQPGGEAAARRAILPMALGAASVLVLQFVLHRFTDFGLELMRSMRLGVFRVLFGALLLHALFAPASSLAGRVFRSAPMVWLGKYSYGLYVYHHFLSYYLVAHGTEFALARLVGSHALAVFLQAAAGMAVSMAIAWASYELVEKHFLRLKRFWPSTRRPALAAGAVLAAGLGLSGCAQDTRAIGDPHRAAAARGAIKLDHFGYRPDDAKVAIFTADPGSTVQVRTDGGTVVFSVPGSGGSIRSRGGDGCGAPEVWGVDFSPFRTGGHYHLFSAALGGRSYEFAIAPDVYADVMRTALRTFFLQRCGRAKPRAYAGDWADEGACHRADASTAPARGHRDRGLRDLSGGWHDAGDYNKYVWRAASTAILFLLRAWEDDPHVFPDGGLGIPESGNGLADVLDEVKWELDFFLRMQLPDGSVLSRVHAGGDASGAAPPSADATPRYYEDPTLESTAVFAGSCARGARVFAAAGQAAYAAVLKRAALSAWSWLEQQGDSDEKAWAAAEIFRLDSTITSARRYVDGYHAGCSHRPTMVAAGCSHRPTMVAAGGWSGAAFGVSRYDTHAAVTYAQAEGATPEVVAAMREGLGREVDAIFAADDAYRTGMPRASYHWGSNEARAEQGVFLLQAARLGATGSHTAGECRGHALDILHFFHGQNPLSMVYLTNMAAQGGEHSSWQVFHSWFGQSERAYSRANYVGKPPSVFEADYPYFEGVDSLGRRDDKGSRLGPAPGYVPGGPNLNYSGDATPPARAGCPSLFYRDWNDQSAWTARTWEITEPSIGYQGPYVALAAAFVRP